MQDDSNSLQNAGKSAELVEKIGPIATPANHPDVSSATERIQYTFDIWHALCVPESVSPNN